MVFATVSCASKPKAPPVVPTVTAAPVAPSAQAPVSDARKLSSEAAEKTASARFRVTETQAAVTSYRDKEYAELKALIDRLVQQDRASTEELQEVHMRVFSAEARIENLIGRLTMVHEDLKAEKELRIAADEKLVEATAKIAAKDSEAAQLRQQFEDQKKTSEILVRNAEDNFKAAQHALTESSRMRGQRDMVVKILIGMTALAVVSLIVNFIQFRSRSIL